MMGARHFVEPVDPSTLDQMQTDERADESGASVTSKTDVYERLLPYLPFLPPLEARIVSLLYKHGLTQAEAGKLVDLSQVAVSARLRKTVRRIRFLEERGVLDREYFYQTFKTRLRRAELEALWLYCNTASYSRAGRVLRCAARDARTRLVAIMDSIPPATPALRYWLQIFAMTRRNVTVHGARRDDAASSEGAGVPIMNARQESTTKSWTEAPRWRRVA